MEVTWSKVHRFMVGDFVALTHDGHELENMVTNLEGKIIDFANEELTHLKVLWSDGTTTDVTEDELRHLPPDSNVTFNSPTPVAAVESTEVAPS